MADSQPSEATPQPPPYVGKRRAAATSDVPEAPALQTSTYVGKRRATAPAEKPVAAVTPAVAVAAVAPALGVPAPRRALEEPVVRVADDDVESTTWRDLRIDTGSLPPIDDTALYATDFSSETTSNLPAISIGKRRADGGNGGNGGTRTGLLAKRFPSPPVLLGVAALAVAVGGAVTAAHAPHHANGESRFVAASALNGASDVGQVGIRSSSVSRSSSRDALATKAAQAAEDRAKALSQISNKETAQEQWKQANQWGLPIPSGGYHLTGRFNDVSGLWATVHTGLDFACPTGTPIHAVAAGTITEVGWAGAYGNRTVETLPDGTELWYAHQVRFGATVGEKVTEGEVMGYVGSTGNTTGPHVHLEVRPGGGDPVDPDTALKAHGIDPDANQS